MKKYYFSENNNLTLRFDLTIIIPTLNRPNVLYAQINSLIRNFNQIKPNIRIQIYISENKSDDDKKIDKNKLSLIIRKNINKNIDFVFIQRKERISLGEHMNVLSKSVNCNWITWIGDDDLLTITYLDYATRVIEQNDKNIQSVFPGDQSNKGITENEFFKLSKETESIQKNLKVKKYNIDSISIVKIINRGTQLSGLLYRKKIINLAKLNSKNIARG